MLISAIELFYVYVSKELVINDKTYSSFICQLKNIQLQGMPYIKFSFVCIRDLGTEITLDYWLPDLVITVYPVTACL